MAKACGVLFSQFLPYQRVWKTVVQPKLHFARVLVPLLLFSVSLEKKKSRAVYMAGRIGCCCEIIFSACRAVQWFQAPWRWLEHKDVSPIWAVLGIIKSCMLFYGFNLPLESVKAATLNQYTVSNQKGISWHSEGKQDTNLLPCTFLWSRHSCS